MKPSLSLTQHLLFPATAVMVLAMPLPGADEPKPTREAFLGEVLEAKPTPVTAKFDDYTPGSYHVDKEDLLKGLTEEATKRKVTLRGVSIVGPLPWDPLWTSYVIVFIQEGEKVRVNSLVMPHARITGKATGLVTAERYKKWLEGVSETGALQKEGPNGPGSNGKQAPSPFASYVLLVTWSKDGKSRDVYHGNVGLKFEKLFEQYNGLLKELKKTYPERGE